GAHSPGLECARQSSRSLGILQALPPFDIEAAVSQQAWDWLFELPSRLNIGLELVDGRHVPVFPAGTSPAAIAVRRVLATDEVGSAISDASTSIKPRAVALDGLQAVCLGLNPTGVLVVARELGAQDSADECRRDLDLIGSWLKGAIEANLTKPPSAISPEPYRIASLRRILNEAMSRGSVRNVVGAFVEALGVWNDIGVRGYAAGANGGFLQYVFPVG